MNYKINVGILFGGQSPEHEVSHLSAESVVESFNKEKYQITRIGIDKQGRWSYSDEPERALDLFALKDELDVIFPVLHGPKGEDGTVQGVLELLGIPYVGAGVLGSALGMDKDVMKRLAKEVGVPTALSLTFEKMADPFEKVVEILGLPLFVKPANGGSSLGVSKVSEKFTYEEALKCAFAYCDKIVIEEAVLGTEIQVGVLGNGILSISKPAALIPEGEFHSYEGKYIDIQLATWIIPIEIEDEILDRMNGFAKKIYRALSCSGMARVDFFLTEDGEILFNEINTIPGLTKLSPFVKMWQASGLDAWQLMDRLISLALEKSTQQETLSL